LGLNPWLHLLYLTNNSIAVTIFENGVVSIPHDLMIVEEGTYGIMETPAMATFPYPANDQHFTGAMDVFKQCKAVMIHEWLVHGSMKENQSSSSASRILHYH
jgi:hypothetical protein